MKEIRDANLKLTHPTSYSLKDIFKSNRQRANESYQREGHLVPMMTESFGGWHEEAVKEVEGLDAALVRQGRMRTRL